VSGKHITDQQVRLFMQHRKSQTQTVAAAKAGISERSARRIDQQTHQPVKQERNWRTREDPLAEVWDSIVLPLLKSSSELTPVGIFDHLCEHHTDQFDPRARRTLERRIGRWRQLHGPAQPVMFTQTHEAGELGIADFTWVKEPVTVAGEALKHKLFHYRLVASGWAYAQVTYGGESFSALSDGLQKAFRSSGGVPRQLRTDSLSAAYKNRQEQEDFTERFAEFCRHYGVQATRNNRGVAHENGAIESPNNHIKRQLKQALLLRGSYDFTTREAYEIFLQAVMARRNRRVSTAFKAEQQHLRSLPVHDSSTYSEHTLRVSRTSTIALKRVTYTVPSRLIGSRLTVRLFDARLELWCAGVQTLTLTRIHTKGMQRQRSVNYHHVIESLVKKPRAFRHAQWRDDLFPSDDYRRIWQHVDDALSADKACHFMVRLLHLAKKSDRESTLGRYVLAGIMRGKLPSLLECEDRFLNLNPVLPILVVPQHPLGDYQALLRTGGCHE
jgi:hypothetical protein